MFTFTVAPEEVVITGHHHATAGDTITLKCTSAISNPPAIITWFSLGQQLSGATKSVKPSPEVSIFNSGFLYYIRIPSKGRKMSHLTFLDQQYKVTFETK